MEGAIGWLPFLSMSQNYMEDPAPVRSSVAPQIAKVVAKLEISIANLQNINVLFSLGAAWAIASKTLSSYLASSSYTLTRSLTPLSH